MRFFAPVGPVVTANGLRIYCQFKSLVWGTDLPSCHDQVDHVEFERPCCTAKSKAGEGATAQCREVKGRDLIKVRYCNNSINQYDLQSYVSVC